MGQWSRWSHRAGGFRHDAGAAHDLPEPAELADWTRFVAIQCPECEGESL